ncbi:MAG: hypothetical protein KGJ79_04035 [Alphaproteobacteria bacterium]|nr:hypothetical protein [Alphaproteobacteria bacterium]MDE2494828.1 hypothetical protein [Alphaproteobacteria bacterium]
MNADASEAHDRRAQILAYVARWLSEVDDAAQRSKEIVEQFQRSEAKKADLNSTFPSKAPRPRKRQLIKPSERVKAAPGKRGAPLGNRNALKHGRNRGEIRAMKAMVWVQLQRVRALLTECAELRPRPANRPYSRVQHGL